MKHIRLSLSLLLAVLLTLGAFLCGVTAAEDAVPADGSILILDAGDFENETLKITVTNVQAENTLMIVSLSVENKTSEALPFSGAMILANGYQLGWNIQVSGTVNAPIDPNTTADVVLYLFYFEKYGMTPTTVSELSIILQYGDPAAYNYMPPRTDPIVILLDQEPAAPLDLTSGSVLYDANDVKVVFLGRSPEGNEIRVYVENNSDYAIMVTPDPELMRIDGCAIYGYGQMVEPGIKYVVPYYMVLKEDGSIEYINGAIKEVTIALQVGIQGVDYPSETVTLTY